MKISHSKRFDALAVAISRCRVAASKENFDGLGYLYMYEYIPLMAAIEEDFQQLSEQFAAISSQVDVLQKAGDEIRSLITEHTKKQIA